MMFFIKALHFCVLLSCVTGHDIRSTISNQELLLAKHQVKIRRADTADLDNATTTIVEAFETAPHYRYVYQFLDQYPEYHWRCIRDGLAEGLAGSAHNHILNVIDWSGNRELPSSKAAAIAIWTLPGHTARSTSIFGRSGASPLICHRIVVAKSSHRSR